MARRLSPEARRAEIIVVATQLIAEEGYRALSLREVARRCGMSAPGLMHHFASMPELLEAVLDRRDEDDLAALMERSGVDAPLVDAVDAAVRYYEERATETRQFDALEQEALDPQHPAHDYFEARNARTVELFRGRIEREFADPEAVLALVRLLFDGIRMNLIRNPDAGGLGDYWRPVRGIIAGLPRRSPARD